MSSTLLIRDEHPLGELLGSFTIDVPAGRITVRELIRRRVYHDVDAYNQAHSGYYRGLVQPNDTELTLNGYRLRKPRTIDREEQYQGALDAFTRNGFILLVNDRQAEELDEEILITPDLRASFIKLMPLVGG